MQIGNKHCIFHRYLRIQYVVEFPLPIHSFFFYKNVVFPAQAEYFYFSTDYRLKISLYYSQIIAYKISVLECIAVSITSVRCLDLYVFCLMFFLLFFFLRFDILF